MRMILGNNGGVGDCIKKRGYCNDVNKTEVLTRGYWWYCMIPCHR